jgi:hypothetical protein
MLCVWLSGRVRRANIFHLTVVTGKDVLLYIGLAERKFSIGQKWSGYK